MKFLGRFIVGIIINAFALILIAAIVPGVALTNQLSGIIFLAFILTLLNFVLKPIIRLILTPIIVLTLGLGVIVVNGIVLYALDILSPDITIQGLLAYLFAALILGFMNFIAHLFFL